MKGKMRVYAHKGPLLFESREAITWKQNEGFPKNYSQFDGSSLSVWTELVHIHRDGKKCLS